MELNKNKNLTEYVKILLRKSALNRSLDYKRKHK